MKELPTLRTERLVLRPFTPDDAPAVQTLCGEYEIALNTLLIPHPYPDGMAEQWIDTHREDFENGRLLTLAIDDGQLAGAVGLVFKGDAIAELGYWVGKPFWGRGYASEAAREMVRYGFETCRLHRIFAMHFSRNPASGRVLRNAGMQYEGKLRQHLKKWDEYLDIEAYGILATEFCTLSRA